MRTQELVRLYAIDEVDLHKVTSGFQNPTFQFTRNGQPYILRVSNGERRNLPAVLSELDWVRHLGQYDVSVAQPVPTVNGALAEELILPTGSVIVTAFEYAPGRSVNVQNPDEWNSRLFQTWGNWVGKMHAVTQSYTPSDHMARRADWSLQALAIQEIRQHFAEYDEPIFAKCEKWLSEIAHLPVTPDTYGLIHNDFHQGNFHLQNGQITAFDFDDCQYSWLANDIAVPFYHAFWQATSMRPELASFANVFLNHFFEGYAREHTLPKQTLESIPLFLKWRELFLLHLFNTRWDHSNLQDWQAFTLRDLRHRILHDIPYSNYNFAQ